MDVIYKVPKNDLINIKTHFGLFKSELSTNGIFPREAMNIPCFSGNAQELKELEESIAIDHLAKNDDLTVLKFDYSNKFRRKSVIEIPKKALLLKTFREVLKVKKDHSNSGYCFGNSEFSFKKVFSEQSYVESDLEPFSEVVISIRFYRPFRFLHGVQTFGPRFSEEFLVLGSNSLSELRDKISCICNNRCLFDISNDPYQDAPVPKSNPGFFFITNTFYNDTRNPLNHDYSSIINNWLTYKKEFKNIEFNTASMEDTRFLDLSVRLGFPQVYQHHGNCEHLFTFSSIQLLSSQCNLRQKDYPMLNTVSFPNVILCHICAARAYTFIVRNSVRQFHDPTYLCRVCFESYYYVDGKKIGEFQVYQLNPDEMIDTIPQEEDEESEEDEDDKED